MKYLRPLTYFLGLEVHRNPSNHADNMSAIQIMANPAYHKHIKYIEVGCHFIHETFKARIMTLPHISTELQLTHIFTEALPRH